MKPQCNQRSDRFSRRLVWLFSILSAAGFVLYAGCATSASRPPPNDAPVRRSFERMQREPVHPDPGRTSAAVHLRPPHQALESPQNAGAAAIQPDSIL